MAKKTKGLTLIELILTIGILSIVVAMAGAAMFQAIQTYALNRQIQDDQHHVRLALLTMTRDAHQSTGVSIINTPGAYRLIFYTSDERGNTAPRLEYSINSGLLHRSDYTGIPGGWHLPFIPAEVGDFSASEAGNRLSITVYGRNITGTAPFEVSTTISL